MMLRDEILWGWYDIVIIEMFKRDSFYKLNRKYYIITNIYVVIDLYFNFDELELRAIDSNIVHIEVFFNISFSIKKYLYIFYNK